MFVFKWIINKKLFTHLSFLKLSGISCNSSRTLGFRGIIHDRSRWKIWLIFVWSCSSDNTPEDTSCNRRIIRAGGASGCSAACLLIAYQIWLSLLPLLLCSVDANDRQDPHLVKAWGLTIIWCCCSCSTCIFSPSSLVPFESFPFEFL